MIRFYLLISGKIDRPTPAVFLMLLAIILEPIARQVFVSPQQGISLTLSFTVAYLLLILQVAKSFGSSDIRHHLHGAIDRVAKVYIGLYCFLSLVIAILIPVSSFPGEYCEASYLYCGILLEIGLRFWGLLAVLDYLDVKRM